MIRLLSIALIMISSLLLVDPIDKLHYTAAKVTLIFSETYMN